MMKKMARLAAASPRTFPGDPERNADGIINAIRRAHENDVDFLVFPELCTVGASLGTLIAHPYMLRRCEKALESICGATKEFTPIAAVGVPKVIDGAVRSATLLISRGAVLATIVSECDLAPFGFLPDTAHTPVKQKKGQNGVIGITYANELFISDITGQNITLVPSALNATATSYGMTLDALRRFSAVSGFACAYAAPNSGESGSFFMFDGICAIASGGSIVALSEPFAEDAFVCADVSGDWTPSEGAVPAIEKREYYLSSDMKTADEECGRILLLQAEALKRRAEHIRANGFVIGVSGGLDSALALLAAAKACDIMGISRKNTVGISMPGFGTSSRTKNNSKLLTETLGCEYREISVVEACRQHFRDIGHDENVHDVVFENAQARERTKILLSISNKEGLLDVGTGDLSEAALGWTTFGGDHLAQYGVNASIPKTIIRRVVAHAKAEFPEAADVLQDILDTPVSPELLPTDNGEIAQKTEELIGSYELHDFFIYHFVVSRLTPEQILEKAKKELAYDDDETERVFGIFFKRFFSQQYKRNCAPEAPHILVSISPSLWHMGSDITV